LLTQAEVHMRVWRGSVAVTGMLCALWLAGCGSDALQKGDLLETTQEVRISGESVWEDGTTEAFTSDVPPGTVFKVLYPQRAGLDIIECEPVKVRGNDDPDMILEFFLPPHLRTRFGFTSFSVTLNMGDIGTALKRLPKEGE
jgi:hypothetical protein